jgi:hypothetical protein
MSRCLVYDNNELADPSPLRRQAKVVEAKAPVRYVCLMKRDEAISRLRHKADLKRLGIEHLYMFGSTARGEAGDDSDVDELIDENGAGPGVRLRKHSKGRLNIMLRN